MQIGILGSGVVAQALATGFARHGHDVMLGTRSPDQLAGFLAGNARLKVGSVAEAAAFAQIVVLAVKGSAARAVLGAAGADALAGKTVIDTCNPIADAPPANGVLQFFTGPNESLLEQLQKDNPQAMLVKAYNSVGSALMIDPQLPGGPPTMFIAGNDQAAKDQASALIRDCGWEIADMGSAEAARAIEPLCMLWCIPGFRNNDWMHAFKVLRVA